MTSSDGGGSAQDEPQVDGSAESSRRSGESDDDPVRRSAPADPWLTEAPTSVLGAATGGPPPADTTPFAAPTPPPTFGWQDGQRPRRATRWLVAVLAAGALFVAGMLAIDLFRPDGDGDAGGLAPSRGATAAPTRTDNGPEPTPTTGVPSADVTTDGQPGVASINQPDGSDDTASADAGAPEVVYEVTASGSRNTGSVSYTDQDGDIIRRNGIALPWRVTFPVGPRRQPLVLIAQRKGGGDAGPVTCTITVNGKLLASTTAHGRYAAPQCSGSG